MSARGLLRSNFLQISTGKAKSANIHARALEIFGAAGAGLGSLGELVSRCAGPGASRPASDAVRFAAELISAAGGPCLGAAPRMLVDSKGGNYWPP